MENKTIEELEKIHKQAYIESGNANKGLTFQQVSAKVTFNEIIQGKIEVLENIVGALSNSRYGNPDNFKSYVDYLREALKELELQKVL